MTPTPPLADLADAPGDLLWWSVAGTLSVLVVAYFASLLLTRWGDREPSAKAFAFSLLLHVWAFCGSYASAPLLGRLVPQTAAVEPQPVRIGRIVPDGDDPLPRANDDRPAWERSSDDAPPVETTRQDLARGPDEPEEVARDAAELEDLKGDRDLGSPDPFDDPLDDPDALLAEADRPEIAQAADLPAAEDAAALRELETDALPERVERSAPPAAGEAPVFTRRARPRAELAGSTAITERGPDPSSELPAPAIRRGRPDESIVRREIAPPRAYGVSEEESNERRTRPTPSPAFARRTRPSPGASAESMTALRRSRPAAGGEDFPTPTRPRSTDFGFGDRRGLPEMPGLGRPIASTRAGLARTPAETYRARDPSRRGALARARGGTAESEQAVEAALAWLAKQQSPDGSWDADAFGAGQVGVDEDGIDRQNAGKRSDSGLTALITLAYLGAGYTAERGDYTDVVGRAVDWLVANQDEDGYLGAAAVSYESMYCHGMATFALGEAYAMRTAGTTDARSDRIRRALGRAVEYILNRQGSDGGWRYAPGQAGDMSMFGWQLMALKSAAVGGIPVPADARANMRAFLDARAKGEAGGLSSYLYNLEPSHPMTAEALYCRQMLEADLDPALVAEAVDYLKTNPPRRSALDLYYWYYGTLAMFQLGGEPWEAWNDAVRETLVAEQVTEGENAGSWNPRGPWGPYGGRLYATAMATLSLEVYYRFLPLYRSR